MSLLSDFEDIARQQMTRAELIEIIDQQAARITRAEREQRDTARTFMAAVIASGGSISLSVHALANVHDYEITKIDYPGENKLVFKAEKKQPRKENSAFGAYLRGERR